MYQNKNEFAYTTRGGERIEFGFTRSGKVRIETNCADFDGLFYLDQDNTKQLIDFLQSGLKKEG